MFALWRVARPAIEALAAERGVPLALHDYAELGLGALSVAEARRRDPYSRPEGFAAEFARLEAGGWLARTEGASGAADARYAVLPRAREAVRALGEAGDARLGALAAMPEADLARLHGLLAAVAAACLAAPEPPRRWASERRFRTADERTPLAGRVREAALDCLAYRDDAHLEAWRGHADPEAADPEAGGALWNAFTHVWAGEARTAEAIARAAAFRGYAAADYARALASLEARGWVAAGGGGAYAATAGGRALRDAVERRTDDWFYAPWAAIGEDGTAELLALTERLLEALARVP